MISFYYFIIRICCYSDNNDYYLSYTNRELVLLKEKTEDNYIFVEIKLNDNLYKLWHLNEKRFIVYDKINYTRC